MERCRGQAAMVLADHVNSWWGIELLIPLLKHTTYYNFCELSMCRPMPTWWKSSILDIYKVFEHIDIIDMLSIGIQQQPSYTVTIHPSWLRFWGSGSLVESK
jgi:hypothetical protein